MDVYIRPLKEEDARTSWRWRNDPEIWRLTGDRPDREITEAMELAWIRRVLADSTCRRYAICTRPGDEYVGNVQLTNITEREAEFHIFIGARNHWGRGIASAATKLVLDAARDELAIEEVYLHVRPENAAAIRVYEKLGFEHYGEEGRMRVRLRRS